MLWVAPNLPVSILGRVLQGFASTIVWTTGLAVLVDTVGQAHIGEYMGYVGIALNAGTFIAPLLGGVLFAKSGYDAIFGLIVAVVGVDIFLRVVMKERSPLTEIVVLSKTASSSTLDLEKAPSMARVDVPIITSTGVTDSSSTLPAILRLCCSVRFLATLWATLVLAATFSGFQTVLPLMVHDTFHWSSIGGGLVFLPLTFPALFGPLVGKLTDRFPSSGRYFAASGFLIMCVSLVILRLVEKDLPDQKALLCVLLVLIGSCMTLALEPLLAEITGGATRLDAGDAAAGQGIGKTGSYGQAYALFNMAWAGGNCVGPLWAGFIIEQAGWKTMTWSLGLLSGVTAVPVLLWCGGWLLGRRR